MDDFLAARSQMAKSLGFHIIFACIGMVMRFFMSISHFIYLKTGNVLYNGLTRPWNRGVAIFFATGAVSGTLISVALGILWPTFMEHERLFFGLPFTLTRPAVLIQAIPLAFLRYVWYILNH